MGQRRWRVEVTRKVEKSLRKIDSAVLRRTRKYIDEIAELENPRTRGKPLTYNKAGLWRYRIGDYRLVCDMHDDKLVIIALDFGHRSTVYDEIR